MLGDTNIVALRAWEVACIATWFVGVWLVYRLGNSRLYQGLYAGASVLAFWDWVTGNRWFFDITFDDRFVSLFRVNGSMEPVWAGFSWGFFFGICALLAVHHGRWLDEHLGAWQYPAVAVALGFLDIVIEGISVGWLDLYRFNYKASYLWWGVPWTNIVFISLAQVTIIFLARRLAELVERVEHPELVEAPLGGGVGVLPQRRDAGWLPFWAAVPIAPAGIYVGVFSTTLLLDKLNPWIR
jgi:hypothetical protein